MRFALPLLAPWLAIAGAVGPADAQTPPTPPRAQENPNERMAAPGVTGPAPELALPPASTLAPRPGALENQVRFTLQRIEVSGATLVPQAEIDAVTQEFVGRPITLSDVYDLTQRLTRLYVSRGFVNSGARAPDQDVGAGVLKIEIVEGRLAEISVTGVRGLSQDYVVDRLRLGLEGPFDFRRLQRNFQVLSEDPAIAEIDARLAPAGERGVARLEVVVRERPRFSGEASLASERSPAIGGHRAAVSGQYNSALLAGDRLTAGFGGGESFYDAHLGYSAPINARDWRLAVSVDAADSEISEAPFDVLDIQSDGVTYRADLSGPLVRRFAQRIGVGAGIERRESRATLGGQPLPLEAVNGEVAVTFARLSQDTVLRARRQAFASQIQVQYGLDGPESGPGVVAPPKEFTLLVAQARYLRRVGAVDQLSIAFDGQASTERLASSMRFSLGGIDSVRGYRRNAVTGDHAARLSAEWGRRLPSRLFGAPLPDLSAKLFIDAGRVWNVEAVSDAPVQELAGAGLELEWRLTDRVALTGYAAAALGDEVAVAEETLQDEGFGYRLTARF